MNERETIFSEIHFLRYCDLWKIELVTNYWCTVRTVQFFLSIHSTLCLFWDMTHSIILFFECSQKQTRIDWQTTTCNRTLKSSIQNHIEIFCLFFAFVDYQKKKEKIGTKTNELKMKSSFTIASLGIAI